MKIITTDGNVNQNNMYKELANKYYKGHSKFKKALAAGIAMDNAMTLKYSKGGTTKTFFMMDNFLKYFDYEVLKKYNLI